MQGLLHSKHQVSFTTIKQANLRLHVERARCLHSSIRYCSSADKRTGRIWVRGFSVPAAATGILEHHQLRPWQQQAIEMINEEPNDRTIVWYWDAAGGAGKTALCKYIIKNFPNTLFLSSGKGSDLTYQIIKQKHDPKIILFNLSRMVEGAFSYAAVESIKDGIVFSGKYEGGTKLFNSPHVLIFANFPPAVDQLSPDRWNIIQL